MADFSELCPLFNSGVFNEITFADMRMTTCATIYNGLVGSLNYTRTAVFTFGRTVVVTGAFVRQYSRGASEMIVILNHHTTQVAAGTVFGTLQFSITVSGIEIATWVPMTVTEKTFTSSEVLGFSMATGTGANAGCYDLIVRYKEK